MTAPGTAAAVPDLLSRFRRHRTQLALLLFAGYVGYYFCRVTLPVALPVFGQTFQFSNTETGVILSAFYAVYAAAKLINGFLGDRLGGKVMLLLGIGGTVACNLAFGFGQDLRFFVVVWGANAFFQSMGWLAMVSILSQWYSSSETGRVMGMMSLSYQGGDFAARASAGALIGLVGWIGVFWAHAGLLAVLGFVLLFTIHPSPSRLGLPDVGAYDRYLGAGGAATLHAADTVGERPPAGETTRWLLGVLAHRGFWLVCVVYLLLSIIRYIFWGWSVQYILSNGAKIGTAVITSAVFPLLGSLGSIAAGWISDRMNARRGPVLAVFGVALTGSIYLFGRIPADQPVGLTLALGLVGFTIYGPYSLMAGAVAMDFGSRYSSATAAGIIDAVGSVGAILTGVGMGYLIDTVGWTTAFTIIVALSAVSALLSFGLWNLRPLAATTSP